MAFADLTPTNESEVLVDSSAEGNFVSFVGTDWLDKLNPGRVSLYADNFGSC